MVCTIREARVTSWYVPWNPYSFHISQADGIYAIAFTFNLLDGGTITGTYTGAVDYEENASTF